MTASLRQFLAPTLRRLSDRFGPTAGASGERVSQKKCKFLQSRAEVEECTRFLQRNNYLSHGLPCKDFDIANIMPEIAPGAFLDMGSSDSYILRNVVRKRQPGQCYGIDLRPPIDPVTGVEYVVGDLMDTKLPAEHFQSITCLSVIEHQVDFARFCKEGARLLKPGGKLFVTFDYWEPKVATDLVLYGLAWQPLDRAAAEQLLAAAAAEGLHPVQEMDWQVGEAVIREGYYSPDPKVSYTFGLIIFEKR